MVSDDPGPSELRTANAELLCYARWNRFAKNLKIETADKMEIVCSRLLNLSTNITAKSFIVTYLNHPSNIAEAYTSPTQFVQFDV